MITLLLSAILFSSVQAQSHSTDWSKDFEAFDSYRPAKKRILEINPPSRILEVYDSAYLKEKLSEFSGALPVTINGKEEFIKERQSDAGKKLARAYLSAALKKMGYDVKEQKYSSTGTNLIAERQGQNPEVVIVSAHMDSVGNAGADDDGSGVISALSIMAALSSVDLKYTLRFIAFDQEELGLVGSKAYAKSLSNQNREDILGVFNLEMTAYNKRRDGSFHVIDCDGKASSELTAAVIRAVNDLKLPLQRTEACTDRSDHASFWDIGVPAVVISQNFFGGDSNPCYHKKCDQVSTALNFEYMSNITESVGLAVKRMVAVNQKNRR